MLPIPQDMDERTGLKPPLPEGFRTLVEPMICAILLEQPEDILKFAADYFEDQVKERDREWCASGEVMMPFSPKRDELQPSETLIVNEQRRHLREQIDFEMNIENHNAEHHQKRSDVDLGSDAQRLDIGDADREVIAIGNATNEESLSRKNLHNVIDANLLTNAMEGACPCFEESAKNTAGSVESCNGTYPIDEAADKLPSELGNVVDICSPETKYMKQNMISEYDVKGDATPFPGNKAHDKNVNHKSYGKTSTKSELPGDSESCYGKVKNLALNENDMEENIADLCDNALASNREETLQQPKKLPPVTDLETMADKSQKHGKQNDWENDTLLEKKSDSSKKGKANRPYTINMDGDSGRILAAEGTVVIKTEKKDPACIETDVNGDKEGDYACEAEKLVTSVKVDSGDNCEKIGDKSEKNPDKREISSHPTAEKSNIEKSDFSSAELQVTFQTEDVTDGDFNNNTLILDARNETYDSYNAPWPKRESNEDISYPMDVSYFHMGEFRTSSKELNENFPKEHKENLKDDFLCHSKGDQTDFEMGCESEEDYVIIEDIICGKDDSEISGFAELPKISKSDEISKCDADIGEGINTDITAVKNGSKDNLDPQEKMLIGEGGDVPINDADKHLKEKKEFAVISDQSSPNKDDKFRASKRASDSILSVKGSMANECLSDERTGISSTESSDIGNSVLNTKLELAALLVAFKQSLSDMETRSNLEVSSVINSPENGGSENVESTTAVTKPLRSSENIIDDSLRRKNETEIFNEEKLLSRESFEHCNGDFIEEPGFYEGDSHEFDYGKGYRMWHSKHSKGASAFGTSGEGKASEMNKNNSASSSKRRDDIFCNTEDNAKNCTKFHGKYGIEDELINATDEINGKREVFVNSGSTKDDKTNKEINEVFSRVKDTIKQMKENDNEEKIFPNKNISLPSCATDSLFDDHNETSKKENEEEKRSFVWPSEEREAQKINWITFGSRDLYGQGVSSFEEVEREPLINDADSEDNSESDSFDTSEAGETLDSKYIRNDSDIE